MDRTKTTRGRKAKSSASTDTIRDTHPKGTIPEPPQTPGAAQAEGELGEVREALHDLEEKEGDWSKGG